jgi:hypothetical protein
MYATGAWRGTVRDTAGQPVPGAEVEIRQGSRAWQASTGADGVFVFRELPPARYALKIEWHGKVVATASGIEVSDGSERNDTYQAAQDKPADASGGEQLSSRQVSALPLNKRDFSQLLLLATGTQTDTNGAANFTQQFTVNGQRGTATVFAMDGIDTTDPEMGGATFSNFNVDAIEAIQSSSGVLPAEIGHGAAGYTNIITKSGTNDPHGSLFEFARNAAFDARNFFDRRSIAQPGRIPPFVRNEFGFTSGGPLILPGVYDGRDRTFYFGQFQGFRQVLGTTQVLPVPSLAERKGRDTTAFPGDELLVPISPKIASVLAQYPLPNDPQGSYGDRTYATSSKVRTITDQYSIRVDHRISAKSQLFARFNLNNVNGPVTNPSQTAIDPSFAIPFFDHQRSGGLSYTWAPSATFLSESSIGFVRSTPNFPTLNRTQPALTFGDGLYEGFNVAAGSILGSYGNLFQARENLTWIRGAHTWKAGAEVRINRDTTIFGTSPNGTYSFGGGAAYSTVEIRSRSGLHNINIGDPLPDALTGFLTATPFSYANTSAPDLFAQGERMGDSAIRRYATNLYVQDAWKVSKRLKVSYGLRYEVNSRIGETKKRTSAVVFEDASGQPVDAFTPGARAHYLINPQPPYGMDWNGWGPRLALDWSLDSKTVFRAGASISTLLPNLWQDNVVTGGLPYVVSPFVTATPTSPVPFSNSVTRTLLPQVYTPQGQLIFASGRSTDVAPNTEMDVLRFERDLAALSPDHQTRPIVGQTTAQNFRNGSIATYTAGLERSLGDVTVTAAYVATIGMALQRLDDPNGYPGADSTFAPYTVFDASGQAAGGFSRIMLMDNRSHSTYHSLQTSMTKNSLRAGLGFQASYTFSKSIDDTSAILGGFLGAASGTVLQTSPQNPRNLKDEKGPSTFDVTHAFSLSVIQDLPVVRLTGRPPNRLTRGWELLGMASLATGMPFTIYSGIQQTAAGSNGSDRPDQTGTPVLSTSRTVREDYFGAGANNAAYFSIPHGRPGTLGRDTFRGPAFRNVDLSLIKNTAIGPPGNPERIVAQFRAEVFNVFNLVNFGLPSNIVLGPGFGVINRTAGPSRQIQLSLKILF